MSDKLTRYVYYVTTIAWGSQKYRCERMANFVKYRNYQYGQGTIYISFERSPTTPPSIRTNANITISTVQT
jgi:hypothetical protein